MGAKGVGSCCKTPHRQTAKGRVIAMTNYNPRDIVLPSIDSRGNLVFMPQGQYSCDVANLANALTAYYETFDENETNATHSLGPEDKSKPELLDHVYHAVFEPKYGPSNAALKQMLKVQGSIEDFTEASN
jgi:hypothetical protein